MAEQLYELGVRNIVDVTNTGMGAECTLCRRSREADGHPYPQSAGIL